MGREESVLSFARCLAQPFTLFFSIAIIAILGCGSNQEMALCCFLHPLRTPLPPPPRAATAVTE